MEQYTRIKAMLASAEFGGLSSATVIAGNFGLAMNGTHYFEAFRFLTGESPKWVSAVFSDGVVANPRGPEFLDRAGTIRVQTASGRRLYIDASADQGHGIAVTYAAPLGRITVDELTGVVDAVHRLEEHRSMPSTRYGMPWQEKRIQIAPTSVIAPTQSVLEALLNGSDFPTGVDGAAAVRTLVAAYRSAEEGGRAIDLSHDDLPEDRVFPWA